MPNDSISIRSASRADLSSSRIDAGQLVSKNQSINGGAALDGLFGGASESSFGKVLDAQVKRETAAPARANERNETPRQDKAGRLGGNASPRPRADAREREDQARNDAAERTREVSPENAKDAKKSDAASTRSHKQKAEHAAKEAATDKEAMAADAAQSQGAKEQKVANEAESAAAASTSDLEAAGQGETTVEGDTSPVTTTVVMGATDTSAEASLKANPMMLEMASQAKANADSTGLVGGKDAVGSAGNAVAAMQANTASGAHADKLASALAASMEAVDESAEADPALKDLISAMLSARTRGATAAENSTPVAGAAGSQADALAAIARELNMKTAMANAAMNEVAVTEGESTPELLAQAVAVTGLAESEEELTMGVTSSAEGDAANAAEVSADALLTQEGTAEESGVVSGERAPKAGGDRPIPPMTTSQQSAATATTETDSWSILDTMADALPDNMPKETAETLKNVTPQVQSEQQMNMVRNELRSLERLVEAGLQAGSRTVRDSNKDEKGLEVKTASLTRAIENLSSTVKTAELRAPMPGSNTPVAFGRPGFAEQMAEKIMLMTTQKVQSAEIRLDPKELGAVDVKIRVHQDQATVVFSSANPQVRDALESSIPRLREMFADAGVGLGSVNVNDRGGSATGGNDQSQGQGSGGGFAGNDEIVEERPQRAPRQPNSLVDYYA